MWSPFGYLPSPMTAEDMMSPQDRKEYHRVYDEVSRIRTELSDYADLLGLAMIGDVAETLTELASADGIRLGDQRRPQVAVKDGTVTVNAVFNHPVKAKRVNTKELYKKLSEWPKTGAYSWLTTAIKDIEKRSIGYSSLKYTIAHVRHFKAKSEVSVQVRFTITGNRSGILKRAYKRYDELSKKMNELVERESKLRNESHQKYQSPMELLFSISERLERLEKAIEGNGSDDKS